MVIAVSFVHGLVPVVLLNIHIISVMNIDTGGEMLMSAVLLMLSVIFQRVSVCRLTPSSPFLCLELSLQLMRALI